MSGREYDRKGPAPLVSLQAMRGPNTWWLRNGHLVERMAELLVDNRSMSIAEAARRAVEQIDAAYRWKSPSDRGALLVSLAERYGDHRRRAEELARARAARLVGPLPGPDEAERLRRLDRAIALLQFVSQSAVGLAGTLERPLPEDPDGRATAETWRKAVIDLADKLASHVDRLAWPPGVVDSSPSATVIIDK